MDGDKLKCVRNLIKGEGKKLKHLWWLKKR